MTLVKKRIRQKPKKVKTKTFTGCWTCRSRKIKCDTSKPTCRRCETAGLFCEGYGIKLYWVTGEEQVAPAAIKRQAMTCEGHNGWSVADEELDKFLDTIDTLDECSYADSTTPTGPFTVFSIDTKHEAIEHQPEAVAIRRPIIVPQLLPTDTDTDYSAQEASSINTSQSSSPGNSTDLQLVVQPSTCIFDGPVHDHLMEYYVLNVTGILPPLVHFDNPYYTMFVPEALQGAQLLKYSWSARPSHSPAHIAVMNIVLSIAAFHCREMGPANSASFDAVGRSLRAKAIRLLQQALTAISCENPDSAIATAQAHESVESIMSAIYTLIVSDVVEGSMSEYVVHLDGIDGLLLQLEHQGRRSLKMNRLVTLCSFFSTVARSTLLSWAPIPWTDNTCAEPAQKDMLPDSPILELAFGITAKLRCLLYRTLRLSRSIIYYASRSMTAPLSLECAAKDALQALSEWSIETEPLALFRGKVAVYDARLRLAECHVLAWSHAIRIYYHTRITPCPRKEMAMHVATVASYLIELESVRTIAGNEATAATTKCWPGFIASCEALPGQPRQAWHLWWNIMLESRIGNISKLWHVVQEVWRLRDEEGFTEVPGWVPVLRRSGTSIVAV